VVFVILCWGGTVAVTGLVQHRLVTPIVDDWSLERNIFILPCHLIVIYHSTLFFSPPFILDVFGIRCLHSPTAGGRLRAASRMANSRVKI